MYKAPQPVRIKNGPTAVPVIVDIDKHVQSLMISDVLVSYVMEIVFIPILIVTISHVGYRKATHWNSLRLYLDTEIQHVVVERNAVDKSSFDDIVLPLLHEFIDEIRRSTLSPPPQIDGVAAAPRAPVVVESEEEQYFSQVTDMRVFRGLLIQQCVHEIRQAVTFVQNQTRSFSKDPEGCTISEASWVVAARLDATTYFAATLLHSLLRDLRGLTLTALAANKTTQNVLFLQSSLLLLHSVDYGREGYLRLSIDKKADLHMDKVLKLDQKGVLVYPMLLWIQLVNLIDSLASSVCLARKQMGYSRYDVAECISTLATNSTVIAMLKSLVGEDASQSLSSEPAAAKLLRMGSRDAASVAPAASPASAASAVSAATTSKATSPPTTNVITGDRSFFEVPASTMYPLPGKSSITDDQWNAYLTGPLPNSRPRPPNNKIPPCELPLLPRLLDLFADYKRADLERLYNVQWAVDSSQKSALRSTIS